MSQRLPTHEWIAIIALSGLLLSIIAVTFVMKEKQFSHETGIPHYVMEQEIEIFVEGAVQKPGSHKARRGMRLRQILDQVGLTKNSDIRRLRLESKVRNGQVIKVPAYTMITIYVDGAVEIPGAISIRKGSSVEDLIPLIKFQENANIEKLRRKRRLKSGETIKVVMSDE